MKVLLDTYERKNSRSDGTKSNAVTTVGLLNLLLSFTNTQLLNRGRGWVLLRTNLQCCLRYPSSLPWRTLWLFLGWLCTRKGNTQNFHKLDNGSEFTLLSEILLWCTIQRRTAWRQVIRVLAWVHLTVGPMDQRLIPGLFPQSQNV